MHQDPTSLVQWVGLEVTSGKGQANQFLSSVTLNEYIDFYQSCGHSSMRCRAAMLVHVPYAAGKSAERRQKCRFQVALKRQCDLTLTDSSPSVFSPSQVTD